MLKPLYIVLRDNTCVSLYYYSQHMLTFVFSGIKVLSSSMWSSTWSRLSVRKKWTSPRVRQNVSQGVKWSKPISDFYNEDVGDKQFSMEEVLFVTVSFF